ncbi:alginate lyase family protein [Polynucleobacter sp. MWH-Spelu-300-X4]|uniref:heparinase II/III family protein n=1 Tax=Polynucleobacter sp. MWH-Spelu-300-X4 TaxID=2689109 RepID=UPI001BFD274B|nr:heparinase II/III family protein [Polynucleobacter sp. MWH-Spelu-300-X4]QWD80053.1 alginate lyase family protein [Polynucleobacter sp. MWH-Spelu-300-X4]
MASKLALYIHTLRYLKPGQIYRRLWYRLARPRVESSPWPDLRVVTGHWVTAARRHKSLTDGDNFSFLNETGRLSEIGWDGPEREKLWRYNQHYFDDLNAAGAAARVGWHQALIKRWIIENQPGQGAGWEPYPTSLRIVNWVKYLLAGHSLDDEGLQSLAIQTRWLSRRIEWHILGNHLFANAKALVFAGLFFEGAEAQKWLGIGLGIITQELPEQVLPDGGNFERSPMYHAIFLEDLLDLINLATAYPGVVGCERVDEWRVIAIKMLDWLQAMCHPDGEITFFNDAAIGIAPSPAEINAYACQLGISTDQIDKSSSTLTVSRFSDTGYMRLETLNAVAFLDVAPIGPDYLPGHSHADTLSFELSLFGERVFVNGGTSQYGNGPVRLDERGTKAHNTLTINGKNSSEVWSGFRVARRAYPIDLEVEQVGQSVVVNCAHDGYKRLHGQPVHKRSWQFHPGKLVVHDRVVGEFETAIAFFHFHPDVKVTALDHCRYSLHLPDSGQEIQLFVLSGAASIEQSYFAPEFGIRLKSQCLAVRIEADNNMTVEISWSIDE